MAADLEELYRHYLARGYDDAEAAARAEQKVLAAPDTLQRLVRVHTSGYERWENRAAGRTWRGFDLALFALGVAPMLAFAVVAVQSQLLSAVVNPWLWPLVGAGAATLGLCALKFRQLFLQRHRSVAQLRGGVFSLLCLTIISPALGLTGFLIGAHRFALSLGTPGVSDAELGLLLERLGQDVAVLGVGLLLGMGAALVWFIFVNRISAIEQAESADLLGAER